MRFGRCLHKSFVPQWAAFYLNYDAIKRLFKRACSTARESATDPDFYELNVALSYEIDQIELFYVRQQELIQQKLDVFLSRYGNEILHSLPLDSMDRCDLKQLLGRCLNIFESLETLLWYGKVNRDGFQNIFRKLRKVKHPLESHLQSVQAKFQKAKFSTQSRCLEDLRKFSFIVSMVNQIASATGSNPNVGHSVDLLCHPEDTFNDLARSAIFEDNFSALEALLERDTFAKTWSRSMLQSLYLLLLRYSVLQGSKCCVERLLPEIDTLKDEGTGINCVHDVIVTLGWAEMSKKHRHSTSDRFSRQSSNDIDIYIHCDLRHLCDLLSLDQCNAIIDKDLFGRTSLHYVAVYGLEDICGLVLESIEKLAPFAGMTPLAAVLSEDMSGLTPLDVAVLHGHHRVVKVILDRLKEYCGVIENVEEQLKMLLGSLLELSVRLPYFETVKTLIATAADVNHIGLCGQTPLYIAAQSGRDQFVKLFLELKHSRAARLNIPDSTNGWTPLIVACVNGHISIARMLLEAGADIDVRDLSGWTAKEHALFRGHIKKDDWTSGLATEELILSPATAKFYGSVISSQSPLETAPMDGMPRTSSLRSSGVSRKQFDFKNDRSHIFLMLGASDERNIQKAVDIRPCFFGHTYSTNPENGFLVEISSVGANGTVHEIQLPILEDLTNEPWLFTCDDTKEVSLVFKIFRITNYGGGDKIFVGSGVGLLKECMLSLRSKYKSLAKDTIIPILESGSHRMIGTITFNFIVVTPFRTSTTIFQQFQGFWKTDGPMQVVGHRGSGANSDTQTNLQISENTLQSFLTAVNLGASAVEFDVQLTKDLVPVIYHDFLVKEVAGGIPLHDLTLEQFRGLQKSQHTQSTKSGMAELRYFNKTMGESGHQYKPRSRSFSRYEDYSPQSVMEQVQLTADGKNDSKNSVIAHSIKEVFPTLEDLLIKLPDSIGFDLEMKYPMLWEIQDRDMQPYAIDANLFVETVLKKIYALGGKRRITFSSFSPEICILLSMKQRDYPILFISKAGYLPVGDIRAGSLQQAIQFAKSWDLAGIVMLSSPLVLCPRLVQYTKSSNLICSSYGSMNDDPKHAKVQADAGLDAIIVNKVRLISKSLSKEH